MTTHAAKSPENKSQSGAKAVSQKQKAGKSSFSFISDLPEAVAQIQLQKMANNSPQASLQRAIMKIINTGNTTIQPKSTQLISPKSANQMGRILQSGSANTGTELIQRKGDDPREGFASNPLAGWNPTNGPIRFPHRGEAQDPSAIQDSEADQQAPIRGEPLLPPNAMGLYNSYASMSSGDANEKCEKAANEIGNALSEVGAVEYLSVNIWEKDGDDDPKNHYVVIFNGNVVDATAQQFPGMSATITPLNQWLQNLRGFVPPHRFCKYVQGGWAECKAFGNPLVNKNYWIDEGIPLYPYTEKKIKIAKYNAERNEIERQKHNEEFQKRQARMFKEVRNERRRKALLNRIGISKKK